MPRFAKEQEPTIKGDSVDLKAFLNATREKPDEKTGEKFENISNALSEALANGTEVKDDNGRLIAIETPDIVAEVRQVNLTQKIEGQKEGTQYAMEYVGFRAKTVLGAMVLAGGKDDQTFEGEGDERREVPSVVKYFNDGFKVLSNNAARARLTAILEGPDKALERAAEQLAKAKGWSIEKARERVKAMLED
jgi:hypothetical protein